MTFERIIYVTCLDTLPRMPSWVTSARAKVPVLILADVVLAHALGWNHLVPLLATGLKRSDLRKRDDDLRLACYCAVVTLTIEVVRLAADLVRRTAYLNAMALKLRAKAAGEAFRLFLT